MRGIYEPHEKDVSTSERISEIKSRPSAVSGVKWTTVSQVGRQAIQLCSSLVIARWVLVEDLGVYGMCLVLTNFAGMFRDMGTGAAIIREKDANQSFLSTIFWLNVAIGLAITGVTFLGAPLLAAFYGRPEVLRATQVISLSFVISGLGIVKQSLLEKEMRFDLLAKIEVFSSVISAGGAILLAVLGFGIWSLIAQSLLLQVFSVTALWIFSPWKPSAHFNYNSVRATLGFSLNIVGFNAFNFFTRNGDNILIGKCLGAEALGYYSLVYKMMLFPVQNITSVVTRVLYPLFSMKQDQNDYLAQTYLRMTGLIALISFPLVVGLMVQAEPIVGILFGEKWRPIIPVLMILAPLGMFQSIESPVGILYQVKGQTGTYLKWGIVAGTFMILGFCVGVRWGIIGVSISYLATSAILFYPNFSIPFSYINLHFTSLVRTILPPMATSAIMGACIWLLHRSLETGLSDWECLLINLPIAVALYLILTLRLNRAAWTNFLSLAKK